MAQPQQQYTTETVTQRKRHPRTGEVTEFKATIQRKVKGPVPFAQPAVTAPQPEVAAPAPESELAEESGDE